MSDELLKEGQDLGGDWPMEREYYGGAVDHSGHLCMINYLRVEVLKKALNYKDYLNFAACDEDLGRAEEGLKVLEWLDKHLSTVTDKFQKGVLPTVF